MTIYSIRPNVLVERVADEAVLVDLATERVITLNTVGVAVWSSIEDGASIDDAIDRLAQRYRVERSVIAGDVDRFMTSLLSLGLISRDAP
jgi:metallophosphoesterase superfamily enzyme